MIEIQFQFPAWLLNTHVNQSGNMTEADIVYSDVIFIKTKEKATEATTSTPDETTYSEVKISKTKSPAESVGPENAVCHGGSKVTSHKLALGLLTALLTAAIIGLVLTSYSYFQTMERLQQLSAENVNLTETCSQLTSPDKGQKTCPAFVNTTNPCLNCQAGWEKFRRQCYYFSDNVSDWETALKHCQQQGADLVHVSSEEEQKFLTARAKELMRAVEDRFWIGLTDSVTEGTWLWVDGSPLEERLTFWINSEPDNWDGEDPERGEDCANLGDQNRDKYCWYDRACSFSLRRICEKPAKPGHLVCAEL